MKICMSKDFTLEGAVQMDDPWTTSPIAHPMFIWELDACLTLGTLNIFQNWHMYVPLA